MPAPTYLIYLDAYHLDDLLFVPGLARMMGRLGRKRPPCLFVHASGEQAERLLDAEGLFPERKDGLVQVRTAIEAALVERAVRQVNRRIVAAFTEEGVPAVGVQGLDRGLVHLNTDGLVTAGRIDWLRDLIARQAVPVVSALVQDVRAGHAREVHLHAATCALAHALPADAVVVVFFTRNDQPGVLDGEAPMPKHPLDAVPETSLADPEAVQTVAAAGFSVMLTSPTGLFGGQDVRGTRILF
jgi:acetylglutamate kinase